MDSISHPVFLLAKRELDIAAASEMEGLITTRDLANLADRIINPFSDDARTMLRQHLASYLTRNTEA